MRNQMLKQLVSENRKPLETVAFVALVVLLAHAIPDPLLTYGPQQDPTEIRWHSIFRAGIPFWLELILVAEILLLLSGKKQQTKLAQMGHANPFHMSVLIAALIWTFLADWHFLTTWQQIAGESRQLMIPMPAFAAVVSCGGLALAMLLAKILDRHWPGYGFWILYVMNYTLAIPTEISRQAKLLEQIEFSRGQIFTLGLLASVPVIAAAASTNISIANKQKGNRDQIFLWMLAIGSGSWVYAAMRSLFRFAGAKGWLEPGSIDWNSVKDGSDVTVGLLLLVVLGLTMFFQAEKKLVRQIQTGLLSLCVVALFVLHKYRIDLEFLSGPEMLVFSWAATNLYKAWIARSNPLTKSEGLLRS